ncbi:MAG: DedA family protein [Patescibacteria group bacterium]|nr:DedA family protein [Patescibacteria group bacterium]
MAIAEIIIQYITHLIGGGGYFFVFFLMILESMIFPVPSEAVMPFAGFLISQQKFSFLGVIFFSTLGSITGSLLSYYIGFYGGKPFIAKYGKYFLLRQGDLAKTENFFAKHGDKTIFISRFVPVVRHLISLPAGAAKMNVFKFSFYTVLGAAIWHAFLSWVGFSLKQNWQDIEQYAGFFGYFLLAVIAVAVLIFIRKRKK